DWRFPATLRGGPQGGVVSPGLRNVYLDRRDQCVATVLLPAYHRGPRRRPYPPSMALLNAARKPRLAGERDAAPQLRRQTQHRPARAPNAPHFRRVWYVRYADDWLRGFSGPHAEAEAIDHVCTSVRPEKILRVSCALPQASRGVSVLASWPDLA